jgi:hypothetical protein
VVDEKLLAKVRKVLDKLGRESILRSYPAKTQDKTAGKLVRGTPVDVKFKTTALLNYDRAAINGETIREGDCYIICGPVTPVPASGMEVIIDGTPWMIVSVRTHTPQLTPVAYEIQLRGTGQ